MATPFVAGQAALLHSLAPALNVRDIARAMGSTAQSLDALNPAFVGRLGVGRPDVAASLEQILSGPLPTSAGDLIGDHCVQ